MRLPCLLVIVIVIVLVAGCDDDGSSSPVVVSENNFVGGGSSYKQVEMSCDNGKYRSVTYRDGVEIHSILKPCNSYQPYSIEPFQYFLRESGGYILARVDTESIGTHCSYGDLSVTFNGISGYDFNVTGHNACEVEIRDSLPGLTDSLQSYSFAVEFFGYNSEHGRKYVSVDRWRVE